MLLDEFEFTGQTQKVNTDQDVKIVQGLLQDFDLKVLEDLSEEHDAALIVDDQCAAARIDKLLGNISIETQEHDTSASFSKVKIQDYPLFLTTKELLLMVDSLCHESFFRHRMNEMIAYAHSSAGSANEVDAKRAKR